MNGLNNFDIGSKSLQYLNGGTNFEVSPPTIRYKPGISYQYINKVNIYTIDIGYSIDNITLGIGEDHDFRGDQANDPALHRADISEVLWKQHVAVSLGYGRKIFGINRPSFLYGLFRTSFLYPVYNESLFPFMFEDGVSAVGGGANVSIRYQHKFNDRINESGFFAKYGVVGEVMYFNSRDHFYRYFFGIELSFGYSF